MTARVAAAELAKRWPGSGAEHNWDWHLDVASVSWPGAGALNMRGYVGGQ